MHAYNKKSWKNYLCYEFYEYRTYNKYGNIKIATPCICNNVKIINRADNLSYQLCFNYLKPVIYYAIIEDISIETSFIIIKTNKANTAEVSISLLAFSI